jgi:signal transduction histidine kinase
VADVKHGKKTPSRRAKGTTVLGRLGIRGKLNLLLLLPLAGILLVATPFVVTQAGNAQSAGTTADNARNARELGGLIWELQRERVLTAGFLASPKSDSAAMERQQRKVDDTVNRVRSNLGTGMSDELASSLVRIGSLRELRQGALRRGVSADSVARTYHALVDAVIDALRLVAQKTSDAEGTRQLTALDALLHANEYGELRGMAFIATAVNRTTGQVLLDDSTAQARMFLERFVQQADVEQAGAVVRVDESDAARNVDALAGKMPDSRNANAVEAFTGDALASVGSQSSLRRVVQDQVTNQITDAASARASSASTVAWLIGLGAAALFALVAILSVIVSRAIASPLRQLTEAAATVADLAESELVRVSDTEAVEAQAPRLTAIEVSSGDEIGQLAVAFNRVQSTAAMLVERQAVTRHNVSLMFANVAQRTQNLVGRQLALVDELERNEQDSRLLESLYRLDHLSTRLRRNADNLLVVSGNRDETNIGGPTELATALRSALAEIEDYQRVRIGDMHEVMLASSLGSDLVLVFAELLENATSFSPPGTFVDVETAFTVDGTCVVSIVDHGIGMKAPRLTEENRRLVERERLDIAPTSVLGLFVVGRLARRHALQVELFPTPGGGVTARIAVPPTLFTRPMPVAPPEPVAPPVAATPGRLPVPNLPNVKIPEARHMAGFSWFPDDFTEVPAAEPVLYRAPVSVSAAATSAGIKAVAPPSGRMDGQLTLPGPLYSAASEANHSGLRRRVVGAQLPGAAVLPGAPVEPAARTPQHDPAAARAAMDGFQSAIAKAAVTPVPPVVPEPPEPIEPVEPVAEVEPKRGGLSRRIPGANLAPGLRNARASSEPPTRQSPAWRARDPESERASLDAFATGMARALSPQDAAAGRDTDPRKESTK